jgi:release factor glutamine methyltransferase
MEKQQSKLSKETSWIIRDKYAGKITSEFKKDIVRLKNGEPVDYIIGWKPFLGCKIDLSLKPLIPRPETEYWVEKAILEIGKKELRILDIFSGSGCIGVAILKHCPNVKVDFAEIDKKIIKQTKINLKINGIKEERYTIIKSNIFSKIKRKYDFILANPPYIPIGSKLLNKKVKKTEPKRALFAGKDGLYFIKKILKESKKHLTKNLPTQAGGQIWMEFDFPQKSEIEKLIKKSGYGSFVFFKDQYKKWRFVTIFLEQ